jgi:hypothetical protein
MEIFKQQSELRWKLQWIDLKSVGYNFCLSLYERAGGVAPVAEGLPGKCEALSSTSVIPKKSIKTTKENQATLWWGKQEQRRVEDVGRE